MAALDVELAPFSKLIEALRPTLGRTIIIGGWAHRLYRLLPIAEQVGYPPLVTDDADVAISSGPRADSLNIRDRLVAQGFSESFMGEDNPPVTHYHLGDNDGGFYAEFLTPLVGGENRRGGRPNTTEKVAGVVAQKLRHLEVLLLEPWPVTVGPEVGFDLASPATIYLPNPVSFVVQKLLIHPRRKREDQPKDVLYVHDTLELFGGSLEKLSEIWLSSVRPQLHEKAERAIHAQVARLFGEVNDVMRSAALIPTARRLSPESVQRLCQFGLQRLFQ